MSQIALYPKDVAALRGVCYGTGKRHLQRLRAHLGKSSRAVVTVAEYCQFHGLCESEVRAALHRR